ARRTGSAADPVIRQEIAGLAIGEQCLRLNGYRSLTKILRGGAPGPEGSTAKLFWSQLDQALAEVATRILGPHSQLLEGTERAPDGGQWAFYELLAQASGIRAGPPEFPGKFLADAGPAFPRADGPAPPRTPRGPGH